MKKLIAAVLIIGFLVGGYLWVSKYARMTMSVFKGETRPATRGDLVVPITASGNIQPASIRKLKSKASGAITEINFQLGARVKQGDLVVKLQDVDERRNRQRALAEQNRAEIARKQAEFNLEQRQGPAVKMLEAKLQTAKTRQAKAAVDLDFRRRLLEKEGVKVPEDWAELARRPEWPSSSLTKEEWVLYGSAKGEADAAVLASEAELEQARIAIKTAQEDIKNAQEALTTAKATFQEAEQRLSETSIYSPIDGMVMALPMHVGEIAMGGTMTLMGGSELIHVADISDVFAVVNVDEADIGQVHKLAPAEARPGSSTQPAEADAASAEKGHHDAATAEAGDAPTTLPADGTAGQIVKIKVEAFPDEDFDGIITQISPQSEMVAAVATFKVWIRIVSDNREKLVGLLNTQAEARFTSKSVHNAVLVPYDAVQKDPAGEGYGVYVPRKNPATGAEEEAFVKCKLGKDNGTDVEVREGIEEGQLVYTKRPLKRDDKK